MLTSYNNKTVRGMTLVGSAVFLAIAAVLVLIAIDIWPTQAKQEKTKPATAVTESHFKQAGVVSKPSVFPPAPSETAPDFPRAEARVPQSKGMPSTEITSDEQKLLAEIPPARPICGALVRNDTNSCVNIEQHYGMEAAGRCRQSARNRLEACNASRGLPSLVFTPETGSSS